MKSCGFYCKRHILVWKYVVWAILRECPLTGLTPRAEREKSQKVSDSHRNDVSPLTQGLRYRAAYDYYYEQISPAESAYFHFRQRWNALSTVGCSKNRWYVVVTTLGTARLPRNNDSEHAECLVEVFNKSISHCMVWCASWLVVVIA